MNTANYIINLAMVDDNKEFCRLVETKLGSRPEYNFVGYANDGESGLKLLSGGNVDVALIDVVLPKRDGISVLEALNVPSRPICLMLSGIGDERITKLALRSGADYYIIKPCDMRVLDKRIKELYELRQADMESQQEGDKSDAEPLPSLQQYDAEDFVNAVIRSLPINSKHKGFAFIRSAIEMAVDDRSLLDSITKCLYPAVAKRHGTTSARVERCIRHALIFAWEHGAQKEYIKLLGYAPPNEGRPTNSAFIHSLVDLCRIKGI